MLPSATAMLPSATTLRHLAAGRVPLTLLSLSAWAAGLPGSEPLVFTTGLLGAAIVNGRAERISRYWDRPVAVVHASDFLTHWLPLKVVATRPRREAPRVWAVALGLLYSLAVPIEDMYGLDPGSGWGWRLAGTLAALVVYPALFLR